MQPGLASDLVRRIRAGDRGAEARLVAHFSKRLAGLLRRLTRNQHDAEDLFQETFSLALVKIRRGDLRRPERLAGFLRGLARNLAIDHYRRSPEGSRELTAPADKRLLSPADDQLSRLLAKERAMLVRQLLAELPVRRDREILTRYYFTQEPSQHICAALGIRTDHFKRVLFRARQRLLAVCEERLPPW